MSKGIWLPEGFDLNKAYLLQRLARGELDKEGQIQLIKHLVEDLAGTYSEMWDPNNHSINDFQSGRRSVGRAIVQIVNLNLQKIKEMQQKKTKEK